MNCLLSSSLVLLLCFFTQPSSAQDIKSYVQKNTVGISTIEPDSLDFSELEAIGNAIGDARIVMLGEQDHGDAPTFLAKTRLIKYLHEKKGFNILAFEADFFSLSYGWDAEPRTPENIIPFERSNISTIWINCNACQQLFKNYIPGTYSSPSPLRLAGFDNQLLLNYSSKFLTKSLDSIFRSYKLPITQEANYSSQILPLIDSCRKIYLKDTSGYVKQVTYLATIKEQLGKFLPANDRWMLVLDNLASASIFGRNLIKFPVVSFNERDKQMAKNLLWLSTVKYPAGKIIVWAQNGHIAKDAGHYGNFYTDKYQYMASVLDNIKDESLKTYSLGFASYQGTAGRVTGFQTDVLKDPKKNGFETWINENYNFAFTDFSKFNNQNPGNRSDYNLKGHGHQESIKTDWHHKFDGIFFIRNMYPCKPAF